jgi:hypothetical protein
MKNIHLLPTDKPSKLHLWSDEIGTRLELCELEYSHTRNTQHIYITNDEEIKEGDWVYHCASNKLFKYDGRGLCVEVEKIILTTDQDLIKDGIQDIDTEFLEWFVQNPSCESVEVDKNWNYPLDKSWEYKLRIIPQEEQKQHLIDMMRGDEELGIYWEGVEKSNYIMSIDPHDKQETLEEAALNYSKQFLSAEDSLPQCDFKKGAKWQSERMYSEEEVLEIIRQYALEEHLITSSKPDIWFEQFKKK